MLRRGPKYCISDEKVSGHCKLSRKLHMLDKRAKASSLSVARVSRVASYALL